MSLKQLIKKLKPAFLDAASDTAYRPCRVFISASDMKSRALTRHASDIDPDKAFEVALEQLDSALGSIKPTILRADWIVDTQNETWAEFLTSITGFRRNHYPRGLALDPDFNIAFIEPEIVGNAMLYRDGKSGDPNCVFNEENCNLYCKTRFNRDFPTPQPSDIITTFKTLGVFVSVDEPDAILLNGTGLAADHRPVDPSDREMLIKLARNAAAYYAADILEGKRFLTDRYPCVDKVVPVNEPHVYFDIVGGMLDVYATYGRIGNSTLGQAITRAISDGLKKFITNVNDIQPNTRNAALTALEKHAVILKTKKYAALIKELEGDRKVNQSNAPKRTAQALIDAYFYPEFAMFFKRPDTIVNTFFLRHSAFRIAAVDMLSNAVNGQRQAPVEVNTKGALERLSAKLKPVVLDKAHYPQPYCRMFLSASDMKSRAVTRHVSAFDPSAAFDAALKKLKAALGSIQPKILRADWIVEVEPFTWLKLNKRLDNIKRNYFRKGLALDPNFVIAFTEAELNANSVFYNPEHNSGFFNRECADALCRRRFNCDFPALTPDSLIYLFSTNGAFIADDLDEPLMITDTNLANDHRDLDHTDDSLILKCVRSGANHLAGEVLDSGQFIYGRLPCFDRVLTSYNTLRHFSSLFAMLDVYGTYEQPTEQSERLLRSIERGLKYGIDNYIIHRRAADNTPVAYIVETRANEIKLGGQGLALLAFTRYTLLTRSEKYLPLMNEIADGIISMQRPDGGFVHVLHSDTLELKDEFRIIYFDGEAVFGLMRLFAITHDARLLESADRAFKHFVATEHWRHHDHWMSYAANELTLYHPMREYFEFGINNFLEILPYIYHRFTQVPTVMELVMAADALLERMKTMPELSDLLSRVRLEDFYAALEERARKLLNGYFWEETAMFFKRPESVVGSFYIRHDAFRVRIDDIQHFLGGLINYRKYLARRDHTPQPSNDLINGKVINPEEESAQFLKRQLKLKNAQKNIIDDSENATIFYGGDVLIGRRMHWRVREVKQFGDIPAMQNADLRIVNLECVVSTLGEQGFNKNEVASFYYHARPEMIKVLTDANIDVVLTANNHSGDYGREALLDQNRLLDQAGVIHVGSGKNLDDASKPIYVKVKDLIVAIFSVDVTTKNFSASDDRAGIWYLPPQNPEVWRDALAERIADARRHADIVFVAPHWGVNDVYEPQEYQKNLGRLMIDLGADAVLGCHAHVIQGVENYNGRPIIYDAGNLLFDTRVFPRGWGGAADTGCFALNVVQNGVRSIKFTALRNGFGHVELAINSRDRINDSFIAQCRALGTEATVDSEGDVEIIFEPPSRSAQTLEPTTVIDPSTLEHHVIPPLSAPRPEWIVDRVPDNATISTKFFGPLKMIGYRIPPECRTMTVRRMIYVETYWTIDQPMPNDCRMHIVIKPIRECGMPLCDVHMDHDFCDWMWPVNRWKPGVIYRERFGVRPPDAKRIVNVDLQVEISVKIDGKTWGPFRDPKPIELQIPAYPLYRTKFSDVIYHSRPDACWTAEQLAAVTGGKWIVEPPEGWFVNSITRDMSFYDELPKPILLVARKRSDMLFHVGLDPRSSKEDTHSQVIQHVGRIAGAMVDHHVEGLPSDLPLLMVKDPIKACNELGFAARQRFKGKMIAITGSEGKTTTCYMLKHVLGQDHEVISTYGSVNMSLGVPIVFANAKQNTAFAIIEIAIGGLVSQRGPLTYDFPPNIAVVTSITPSHLKDYVTTEGLVRRKVRIFKGMQAGDYAVLNRDMLHYDMFEQKALETNLNIISFGRHKDSTIRMLENGLFIFGGRQYRLECPVPAEQLYDALAVIGVSIASGFSLERTLEYLKTFEVVKGRGNVLESVFDGKNLRVIDSAYNASPPTMVAALEYLKTLEPKSEHRVVILGDMAELGTDEIKLHRELASAVLATGADRVLLVGALMKNLWEDIKEKINGTWFPTYKELLAEIGIWLRTEDTILLKASNSTMLSKVADYLTAAPKETSLPTQLPLAQPSLAQPSLIQSPLTQSKIDQPTEKSQLNIPSALFDVKEFLPKGITSAQNGRMPMSRMRQIACGGFLYIDAARSWNAMVKAAKRDGVKLIVKNPFAVYRTFQTQDREFRRRFTPIGADNPERADAIRVEFEGKTWQLNKGMTFAQVPGQSSHSYGLAVDIWNEGEKEVQMWLDKNAESFGFRRELKYEPGHFTYVRSREGLPDRVLNVEKS